MSPEAHPQINVPNATSVTAMLLHVAAGRALLIASPPQRATIWASGYLIFPKKNA
jgi:hypothetical protein